MTKEEKELRKKIIQKIKDFEKQGYCLAKEFDAPNCSLVKPLIDSHSIANSSMLYKIEENGKVLARKMDLTRNFHILDQNGGIMDVPFEPVSTGIASVFPGFCENHDRDLFNKIDQSISTFDDETLLQLHYRAISYECYQKIQSIKVCKYIKNENSLFPIEQTLKNEQEVLNALRKSMNQCKNAYLTKKYSSSINGAVFSFNSQVPTLCVGCWFPEMDIDGNSLFDLYNHTKIPVMSFTLGMDASNNAFFAITYTEDDENSSIQKFINNIQAKHLNDELLLNKIIIFSLIVSQNAYCKPSWFNSLPKAAKDFIHFQFNNFEKDHYLDLSLDVLKTPCKLQQIR